MRHSRLVTARGTALDIKPGSFTDIAAGTLLIMAMALMFHIFISFVSSKIIALKSLPDRRAFWTVIPGYVAVTGMVAAMLSELGNPFISPFATAPGGLLLYWWYRREFRNAWVDDTEGLPEGVTLQNDDWQIGVAGILILLVFGLLRLIFKTL